MLRTRLQQRQHGLDRAEGGLATRRIAVEAQHRLGAMRHKSFTCSSVSAVPSGATASPKPACQRDDIEIAFDRDHAIVLVRRPARARRVEQQVALVKKRRVGRVEIFRRRSGIERAPAESDDAPAQIGDRKDHAVAEAVVGTEMSSPPMSMPEAIISSTVNPAWRGAA